MSDTRVNLPQGTLDLLILRALALQPMHGWRSPSAFTRCPGPRYLARLVVGGGRRLVIAGVAIGAAIALWAGRAVEPLLFRQQAADPIVFLSVAGLLIAVALLATALPALSAARVDAQLALRAE